MKTILYLALLGCTLWSTVSAGGGVCIIDGVTYSEGQEIPDDDPCQFCRCNPQAPDQQLCGLIGCLPPVCGACGITSSPDECCDFCVPECNINNVTYCDGDVVSNTTCETCTCAPDAPGQQICLRPPCFSITDCGGFPMVTPPGECCPKCPTCDVVGPGYEPGDKLPIPDYDPCSFSCVCDSEGRTACAPAITLCPTIECPRGTVPRAQSIPGECCDNVTCEVAPGCEVNGTEYAVGDPVPSDNPCEVGCFCGPSGNVQCAIVDCPFFTCAIGEDLVYPPGRCCPICVPLTNCVIDNVTYSIGDDVPNNDPCETCSCDPRQPDQQRCSLIFCDIPVCGECGLDYDPEQCCPGCKAECSINNVTYCDGDVVSNTTCETCTCAPDAPGQQICLRPPCFSITDCGGFPMVTPSGECCPKCPTCDVVGPGYKPGDKLPIPDYDPCSFNCFCDGEGRTACTLAITLCPDIECPRGTVPRAQSIPGECCDNVTCEVAPGCEVNGTEYAVGDPVPSDNPCRVGCFCGPSGNVECAIVDCPFFTCAIGEDLVYPPGRCCPICVPLTNCVIDNVTYSIGDDVPNNDPCETCSCDPRQPDQQLCSLILCGIPVCGECGLDYDPEQCCPGCKAECNINNVTYCDGDVVSNTTCETCTCAPDASNQQACFGPTCFLITDCGGFDVEIPPGECCPKCPTCDVVGPGYEPGDKLPIPDYDPCSFDCFCDSEGRTACVPIVVDCDYTCPPNTRGEIESIPGQCCGNLTCVPIEACELNGVMYAPGESMPSDDPCMVACFCDGSSGQPTCAIVDCFNFECPKGQSLTYLPDQCCPICVPEYPDCSFRLCKRRKNALCAIPDAAGNCTCNVTSCKAAYYSMDERPPPPRCTRRNKCADLTGDPLEKCLKKWGNCVKNTFRKQHGKTSENLRKNAFFKALEYPCGD